MASTRKTFLSATAAAGAAILVARESAGPAGAATAATPTPAPAAPTPTPPPSPAAQAFAQRMRAFDATLSDKQIQDIAGGIQGEWTLGAGLRTKAHPLVNGDAPDPQFAVEK
jgi:hypothetical protein